MPIKSEFFIDIVMELCCDGYANSLLNVQQQQKRM